MIFLLFQDTFFKGDYMDMYIGSIALGILYLIALFLLVCGLMSAIIIANHLSLVGWNWWFMFLSMLGVFWGGAGGSLVSVKKYNS